MTDINAGQSEQNLSLQIDEFLGSLAPDLNRVEFFVPWSSVAKELARIEDGLSALQRLIDEDRLEVEALSVALQDVPSMLDVLHYLFVAPSGAGFADGRELPASPSILAARNRQTAHLALDLGLKRLAPHGTQVELLVQIAIIALDARRRGYRRRDELAGDLVRMIDDAIAEVSSRTGQRVSRMPTGRQPAALRNRYDAVIATSSGPVAAITTVFQAQSGGRQQRDLAATYPRLQEELDALPMSLVLIADGRGLAETPRRILELLFESVGACLTFGQVTRGALVDALADAVVSGGVRSSRRATAQALVDRALGRRTVVKASELPMSRSAATVAMAAYAASHPDLALLITDDPPSISWVDVETVREGQALVDDFHAAKASRLLAKSLSMDSLRGIETDQPGVDVVVGEVPEDRIIPRTLVIAASPSMVTEDLVRAVSRKAKSTSAAASVAALITPRSAFWRASTLSQSVQRSLATSVIVLEPADIVRIAGSASPRDAFAQAILVQADLTKASPFTQMGATPRQMFFGRSSEVAALRATVRGNSAALIGGRRIGKTSLMQRVVDDLREDGWLAYYADLQEAGDWRTFAAVVGLRWGVSLPDTFEPSNVMRLVRELQQGPGRVVLFFDEVDHLIRWDLKHDDGHVPEAFFRACRAVSQQGLAQFVFSGERLVSERLWDPSSPHWNFCKPIPVQQLGKSDAWKLLSVPLRDLGIAVDRESDTLELIWDRTGGHPQLIQYVGGALIDWLNAQPPRSRSVVHLSNVLEIVGSVDYRRHYCRTYWGQASDVERWMSAAVSSGAGTVQELRDLLAAQNVRCNEEALESALRMLDLYGIIDGFSEPLRLRATWLPEAMEVFGGVEAVAAEYLGRLR
jgi:hypothetical protein